MMSSSKLQLLYQNVRGLRTKTNEFYNNTLLCNADIILVTESWLHDGIQDSELCRSEDYDVFRCDRASLGGGTMIMSAPHLGARARPDWHCNEFESVWITIPGSSLRALSPDSTSNHCRDFHVGVVYLPPDKQRPTRISKLIDVLSNIISKHPNENIILTGDFNLPCIQWTSGDPVLLKKGPVDIQDCASLLINSTNFAGLTQYNTLPNSCNNTLDLIFSNFPIGLYRSDIVLVKEDVLHPTVSMDATDILVPPLKPRRYSKRQFRKANYPAINDYFLHTDWDVLLRTSNIKDAVDNLYDKLNAAIDSHVPLLTISSTYTYPVWYSRELIKLIKEKAKAHSNWKKYDNKLEYETFSYLRAQVKILQDSCHKSFIEHSEKKIKSCPKFFWSYVKSRKKNKSDFPNLMYYQNKVLTNNEEICLSFNDFFCNNFSLPTTIQTPSSSTCNIVSSDTLHTIHVDEDFINKLLKSTDPNKGSGSDNIPSLFFVNCADTLAKPITILFNRCFQEGYFPIIWKSAHIIPIHKKGTKTLIENYRPISILNTLSKLMEKTAHFYIYPFIYQNIPSEQHGFIKGRSTVTNLSIFTSDVLRDMDGGSQVDVIYTDFEKAFDRVNHIILLRKLRELGICGDLLRWLESYLRNRSQAVVVGGHRSDYMEIPSGVPQGSILAPLLYAAYLYDISSCFHFANYLMYADDTKIYYTIKSLTDSYKLQQDLDRLNLYYKTNKININVNKCMFITFTRKLKRINFEYKISDTVIKHTQQVRDLGVLLDCKLSFNDHIADVVRRAYKNLGFILRVTKPFSDTKCLILLYFAFVRSTLEYCCNVWSPQYITHKLEIEKIQCKFIKHLNYRSQHRYGVYEDSCDQYKILTLQNRRRLLEMSFLHKICNGSIDSAALIEQFLRFRTPSTRTRHTPLFYLPRTNTNYYENSIVCRTQKAYNKFFGSVDLFNTSKYVFRKCITDILLELNRC